MSDHPSDRRREPRFSIGAKVILRGRNGAGAYSALTRNISTGGLLLQLLEKTPFQIGQDVICEIELQNSSEHAFASWGVGRVVRIDPANAAIELSSGIFTPEHAEVPIPDSV
jgi:Tfp pilus assembly protein PilZ